MDWPVRLFSPFYINWLRDISGVLSPYSTGWPRTGREVFTPSYIDKLNHWGTHCQLASLIVHTLYGPAELVRNPLLPDWQITVRDVLRIHLRSTS